MFILLQSSQVTVPVWLAILGPLISASGTYFATWVNRKKRGSQRVEDDKVAAEATRLNIESIMSLVQELRETRTNLTGQLIWHEKISIMARKAAHAAMKENQRAYLAIRLRDEVITEGKLDEPPRFEPVEYEDIVNFQALPLPPQSER